MKHLSSKDLARDLDSVLDDIESNGEEIVVMRDDRQVARLVPEAPQQNVLEVFADLYNTLDEETASAIVEQIEHVRKTQQKSGAGTLSELRNPWAS